LASSALVGQGQKRVPQFHAKAPAGGTDPARLNPQTMDVPDLPVKLQDHFLACQVCGIAVRIEDENDVISVEISAHEVSEVPVRATQNPVKKQRPRTVLSFALCSACRQAYELAEQLSGDPATRSPWGRASWAVPSTRSSL
jgi:hypothetical protein